MKPKHIKTFCAALLISGILALAWLVLMPLDAARGRLVNYGMLRGALIGLMSVSLLAMAWLTVQFQIKPASGQRAAEKLDSLLASPEARLFNMRFSLKIAFVFLVEAYLLTFFSLPVPARPILVWLAFACLAALAALRLAYRDAFKKRPSFFRRLRTGWQNWSDTQRRVLVILAVLGMLYFAAFIPANAAGGMHPDEDVIYPDVVNMLIAGDTITDTLRDSFIISSWWYGYPYFPLSALTLVIPRLIYGNAFGSQVNLNLLLLRQFISVLPMVVSLIFLIYLVNEFRHLWASVGMAIVLGLIPGVVHYNIRFWHPDGIIVLLVLLTLWLLKRDRLRFGRDFYLAAFAVGLNAVIKIWGLFFFLAIGGYLLAGWLSRKLDFWRMAGRGCSSSWSWWGRSSSPARPSPSPGI